MPPRWALIAGFYLLLLAWIAPVLRSALSGKSLHDMVATLRMLGAPTILSSAACVAGVYLVMCAMEVLALRDARYPWLGRRSMVVPLLANAVSMSTGFGAVSGAGLRVRLYQSWNIDPANALFVASSVTVMSVAGGAFLAAGGLVLSPSLIADSLGLSAPVLQFAGAAILCLFLTGLALAGDQARLFSIAGRSFRAPRAAGWAARIGAGAADWLFSAAALYLLLPPHLPIGFLSFAALFSAIHLGAMATGLPGGIGVFDAVMLRLCPPTIPIGAMAAALIAYRLLAFVAPSVLGALGLALFEAHGLRARGAIDHAWRRTQAARLMHWTIQAWARWQGPRDIAPRRIAAPRTVRDIFRRGGQRRRVSLQTLVGKGPVLVIAPHPDDETLGCGGLLAACTAHKIEAHVVILTNGDRSHAGSPTWTPTRLAAWRAKETYAALGRFGLTQKNVTMLGLPDGRLLLPANRRRATEALQRLQRRLAPSVAFTTWPHDPHPDHIAAAIIAARLKARSPRLRVAHYPIWGRFLPGDLKISDRNWRPVLFDVRRYRGAKRLAIRAYRSQTTPMINDAPIAHRLARPQLRAFMAADEIFFL